ncbi:MAG TPA: lyase family protein, partial [Coriobacteriia bacterium]
MPDEKTPWGGRFAKPLDAFVTEFGASLPVDRRMWEQDIRGSVAHAKMLAKQGIISDEDAEAIELGLSEIYGRIEAGDFEFRVSDEDIHMAIERALIERIGDAGKRLHTARSRNDQVTLDTRMYAKDAAVRLVDAANGLRSTLIRLSEEHSGVVMPGYTHLQKA